MNKKQKEKAKELAAKLEEKVETCKTCKRHKEKGMHCRGCLKGMRAC